MLFLLCPVWFCLEICSVPGHLAGNDLHVRKQLPVIGKAEAFPSLASKMAGNEGREAGSRGHLKLQRQVTLVNPE